MTENVFVRQEGGLGRITLNRPEALHALNLDMCHAITAALRDWASDDGVHMVLVDHADQTRGFCAGGDIVMLRDSGLRDGAQARAFFAEEYRMNAMIKAFPKPYLAIMDGVTMGGGVGLSVHGTDRVATERTVFAMPETGIGLFPDVGGGWFLPRLRGELGTWLALTGARLKGGDVVAAGIATHFIPSELIPNLKVQLVNADLSAGAAELLGVVLRSMSRPVPDAEFAAHMEEINTCFAGDRAEDIRDRLLASGSDWARAQGDVLMQKSPETVIVALRQLRLGRVCASFSENMAMEYRIGWRKVQSHDFIEGVRAVVIDKDHRPNWSPSSLEAVRDADIEMFFQSLGEDELVLPAISSVKFTK
jgi:enoyl-CoA hydratase